MDEKYSDLSRAIRDIPDFPKKGIIFKDITPLLASGLLFHKTIEILAERYRDQKIDAVLGIESRGFIIGAALAYSLGAGFSVVRKPGKLPFETRRATYQLEYGSDCLEIHSDAVKPGARVLVVDDLLATGGTAAAACELVHGLGAAVVESAFLIELAFLKGREKLNCRVFSILKYDSE